MSANADTDPSPTPGDFLNAESACSEVVDAFRNALRNGVLQQRIHDEWVTVDPEKISVGYVARAHHWKIIPQNLLINEAERIARH